MRTSSNDPLVAATARLLSADPTLTNLEIVRKLASNLGEEMVQSVPVNRFQRQVRDPALRLLRSGRMNGEGTSTPAGPPAKPAGDAKDRSGSTRSTGSRPHPSAEVLQEALLEAFVLGSSWEDRGEGVAALRRLKALRQRVERKLTAGG